MSKRFPYCMKKKKPQTKCVICGTTIDDLLGKTMPGIIKGMCHKDYTLFGRYKKREVVRLIRSIRNLEDVIKKQTHN